MARKKASPPENAAPTEGAPQPAAPANVCGLPPDDYAKHAALIAAAKRAWADSFEETKRAKAGLTSARKKAKQAGMDMEAFDLTQSLAARGEASAMILLRNTITYCGWGKVPVGTQSDIFAVLEDGIAPSEEAWRNMTAEEVRTAGYEAGRAARDRDDNPHEAGSDMYDVWDRAWLDGQAANAPLEATGETVAPATRRRTAGALAPPPPADWGSGSIN